MHTHASARAFVAALVMLTAIAGCRRNESAPADAGQAWAPTVQSVTLPAPDGSIAPQLTASSRGVMASWVARDGETAALEFSEWTSGAWSPSRRVASGNNWFLSFADAPSVMRLSDGTLVANWFVTTRAELEAYDLFMAHSADDGRTWSRPFKAHQDRTQTQHGFPSFFEMPDRRLGLVWLDGRDMENNTTHPEGGVMMLRFTSFDRNWKPGADVVVNERVCECCQTAAVMTSDGVVAAFRDRSDTEIRDIAVTRLEGDTWTEPHVVHADNWEILVCPVNGPALSANGANVAVAWYTAAGEEGHAYVSFSNDAGRTWGPAIRIDEKQSVGHVDVELLDDGSAVASWVEFADQRQRFSFRRVAPNGDLSPVVVVAGDGPGRVSGYPRILRQGADLHLIWTESEAADDVAEPVQRVKGAVARLPDAPAS